MSEGPILSFENDFPLAQTADSRRLEESDEALKTIFKSGAAFLG